MNKVILMGRLTANPRMKETKNGNVIASFTLAVDRYKKDMGADFIPCKAFGRTADVIAKYSGKGKRALIEGRISIEKYEDNDGNKRTFTEVSVNQFDIIDWKNDDEENMNENYGSESEDLDIPF